MEVVTIYAWVRSYGSAIYGLMVAVLYGLMVAVLYGLMVACSHYIIIYMVSSAICTLLLDNLQTIVYFCKTLHCS